MSSGPSDVLFHLQDVGRILGLRSPRFAGRGCHAPKNCRACAWTKECRNFDGGEMLAMQTAVQHHLAGTKHGWLSASRSNATCSVVGSSASLLAPHAWGEEIDSADVVFRVNMAPADASWWSGHVGSRTTVRVWGFMPLPWETVDSSGKPIKPWSTSEQELIVIFCPPVSWVSRCWKEDFVNHPLPRLAPSLAAELAREIGLPSGVAVTSGAMAVRTALKVCARVSVYGFGRRQRRPQHRRHQAGACKAPSKCWRSVRCVRPLRGPNQRPSATHMHATWLAPCCSSS